MGALLRQLFADHRGDAERPALGQVLAEELGEHPAEDVALVVAEHRARLERPAHLLAEQREEHTLEALGDLFHAPLAGVARQGLTLNGSENVHVSAPSDRPLAA